METLDEIIHKRSPTHSTWVNYILGDKYQA